MRLSTLFDVFEPHAEEDNAAGVTIDVMTGIVAGLALVLAMLILAASLKSTDAVAKDAPAVVQTIH